MKHILCKNCGHFKGKMIIDKTALIDKKAVKAQKAEVVSKA
jgi:hypothetical protein